jgi:uncharacterized protein (TIGR04255 family)
MEIPSKIKPCPIVEAIIELRFSSDFPDDAVFGLIYNAFRDEYPTPEKLPILQLPERVRSQDPNLTYMPHYRSVKDQYLMQIGPKMFSFANIKEYVGWDIFSKEIYSIIKRFLALGIVNELNRIGLRYINIFKDFNIFEESRLKIFLDSDLLCETENHLSIAIPSDDFNTKLIMANNSNITLHVQKENIKGSIVDIDVSLENSIDLENFEKIVEESHKKEKELFFKILTPKFLKTLNPVY